MMTPEEIAWTALRNVHKAYGATMHEFLQGSILKVERLHQFIADAIREAQPEPLTLDAIREAVREAVADGIQKAMVPHVAVKPLSDQALADLGEKIGTLGQRQGNSFVLPLTGQGVTVSPQPMEPLDQSTWPGKGQGQQQYGFYAGDICRSMYVSQRGGAHYFINGAEVSADLFWRDVPEGLKKTKTITINARPYEWPRSDISYAELVLLDRGDIAYNLGLVYSITYRRGPADKPEGILSPGCSVGVRDGMIFNVSDTSNA